MVKNTRDSLVFLTPLKIDIEFLYNDIVFAQILRKSFMNTKQFENTFKDAYFAVHTEALYRR